MPQQPVRCFFMYMAKDPAFLFYPGDYLRDTQCLSEKSQVAYDRIMCEHMRNICISQQQLNFFIKRLSDEEKTEVTSLLKKVEGGFQIEWVAESICKRRDYSKSRAENRKGKSKNISSTYVKHMEIEIENEDVIVNNTVNTNFGKSENLLLIPEMSAMFKKYLPQYPQSTEKDYRPLYSIAAYLCEIGKLEGTPDIHREKILTAWEPICQSIAADNFYKQKSLSTISNHIQEITQNVLYGKSDTKVNGKQHRPTMEGLKQKLQERFDKQRQAGSQ